MTYYEPHEHWDAELGMWVRHETWTFPGFGMSVTCTYFGQDPDPAPVSHVDHRRREPGR